MNERGGGLWAGGGRGLPVDGGWDELDRIDGSDGGEDDDDMRCGDGVKMILTEGRHWGALIAS